MTPRFSACSGLVAELESMYFGWEGAEQFKGTSERLSRMYQEFCWPIDKIESELSLQFKTFKNGYDEMQVQGPNIVRTLCPHHLLPARMNVWIGYIPNGLIMGLSKFARVAVIMGKRPIMQEQYASELANKLMEELTPKAVAVYIEGSHNCMTNRGIQQDAIVATSALRGVFLESSSARAEFFSIVRGMKP